MAQGHTRPAGTGRIIPRGIDPRTGRPKWLIRWYTGSSAEIDQETGQGKIRQKYNSRIAYGTRKGADRQLREELRVSLPERRRAAVQRRSRVTVREFSSGWLDEGCPTDRNQLPGPRTCRTYREDFNAYVLPTLGDVLLADLTVARVQRLVNDLTAKPLAYRTIEKALAALRCALFTAEARGLIDRNPCRRDKGAGRLKVKLPTKVTRTLTPLGGDAELQRFLDVAKKEPNFALWLTLYSGGFRPGEAGGLMWDDLDGDTLRVLRVLELVRQPRQKGDPRREPERVIRTTTKTHRDRAVLLPHFVADYLRGPHKARQAADRLKAGEAYTYQGFIFANGLGQPIHATRIQREFKRILKRAGLPSDRRVYDLRHSCATSLAAAGVHPKIIAERLGHADPAFTLRTYAGFLDSMQGQAADSFERRFGGGVG